HRSGLETVPSPSMPSRCRVGSEGSAWTGSWLQRPPRVPNAAWGCWCPSPPAIRWAPVHHRSAASVDVGAAVDVVGGAGDVAGLLAAQEGDQVGDIVHVAVATHRDTGEELRLALALEGAAGDVGVDQAGGNGIDRQAVRADLAGQGPREAELSRLGG